MKGARRRPLSIAILVPMATWLAAEEHPAGEALPPSGSLELRVGEPGTDRAVGELPCRIHLAGPEGRPVRAEGLPFFHDHFDCDGSVDLDLAAGEYGYTVARGPEYREVSGRVKIEAGKTARREIELPRWIDLAARGWWSGETHYHRPLDDTPLLLQSSDLHFVPVLTQWNQSNRWAGRALPESLLAKAGPDRVYHVLGCEDERAGGALMYFGLSRPLDLKGDRYEFPSPVRHLREARRQEGVWIEVEKPFWWDVPTWVATGEVDTVGIANNHMYRDGMLANEAWGRPRDTTRWPSSRGNGFYSQELYYRLLECGFRIPPTAGSASGVLPNPVGYNRVYVHIDGPFSFEAWRRGLLAGRSFVTNGPILLVEANGRKPGAVFQAIAGQTVTVALDVRVDGNDPLEAVEVIRNGRVVQRLDEGDLRGWIRPDPLRFGRSGWFLVRAIARVKETFRFASTAPFHVEVGSGGRRVDAEDVRFFIDWIEERMERIRSGASARRVEDRITDPDKLESVLAPHREALRVFEGLLK